MIRLATVVIASAVAVSAGTTAAGASGPFSCRPGFYQVISGHLKILNPLTGVYSNIGTAGDTYNAIGYNPRDNYIYGWGTSGAINGQLIKVDSAGTVTALGNAGLSGSFVSGDFDDNNNLYFRRNSTTLVRVNVAATPPTGTDLTITSGSIEGVDMGWIDGFMYSVNNSTLYRVNLSTLTATSASIAEVGSPAGKEFPTSGSQSYGAIFSNRSDELYASNNGLGKIYRISDYTTANPKGTWVVDATITSNNDGAACKQAASPFDVPTASNDTYSTTNDVTLTVNAATGILANDSAATPRVISSTNPASGTLTLNSDGSFTFRPTAGFVGSTTFTYVAEDQWGRSTSSATVTINVTAPAATTTAPAATTTSLPATSMGTAGATTTTVAMAQTTDESDPDATVMTLTNLPRSGVSPTAMILGLLLLVTGWVLMHVSRRRHSANG